MKNVTITLEEDVAHWARVLAARRNTSVSRLLGELLREMMEHEEGYEAAMAEHLAMEPTAINTDGGAYPARDQLHER